MTKKRVEKSEAEWREVLSEDQYRIMREHGTERAFTGEYYHHKEKGHYACGCCKTPLFWWDQKYDSGSGWPSFWAPYDEEHIETKVDSSLGMVRKEILCSVCDAHLGHVFDDGPEPSGLRYCVNSASLDFEPESGDE